MNNFDDEIESKPISELVKTDHHQRKNCEKHGDYESRNIFGKVWSGCQICAAEQKLIA